MINFKVYTDEKYIELKRKKDNLRDMIDGELNRISVSDDFNEKEYLYNILKSNIDTYYDLSCKCTKFIQEYK